MNLFSRVLTALSLVKRQRFKPSSLQFRLTAGMTAASSLGLGSIAVLISWTMQQLLVTTHIQRVQYIADRLPRDVELYGEMLPTETAVQRAINNSSSPSLMIWAKRPDGMMLAESPSLQLMPELFQSMLMEIADMPLQPKVYQVRNRYFVLYSDRLAVDNVSIGQFYIAQDITEEQAVLTTVVQRISIATVLIIMLLTLTTALYIRRSLRPLRKMSQLAETISVDELSQSRLYLDRAPDEVRELAQMLDAMLSRLSQSWEQQRQFVNNISHELRTPLSVVSGYLQSLLRRSASFTSSQQEALEIAASETDRTVRLLQDLLDLARMDSSSLYFHQELVVLNDLIAEIANMGAKFSNHTIEIEAEQPKISLRTDRDRLAQVLINLLDNAVKYSFPEDVIMVKLSQTEEQTVIQVIDRGCGIALQHQARIFERFYRVDEARARSTGGVGLGLAIVKSLVEGMKGQVTVWSKPNEGSVFTVTLPNL
ncbi:MAG: HAMP domain-containing histidine kinase [Leptolyngbyaceae cyanobacterium SM1_3_5]|nr:HAMP domain-containing histidine kinase [Leptolyngbyaceae cyanobacterium SM1_3_5]